MKFKHLFLGMLAAAAIVSCNNESVDPNGPDVLGGDATYATFQIKFGQSTYAHATETGSTEESKINSAALFIYKLDGTPEAMIYATPAEYTTATGKITVKCKSGDKLIYLAANLGPLATSFNLINHGYNGAQGLVSPWLGVDWSDPATNPKTFAQINVPVWSTGAGATTLSAITTVPAAITGNGTAEGLIKALINNGDATVATGYPAGTNGTGYFMTNWGDAAYQEVDEGGDAAYDATVKFKLEPQVSADNSRGTTGLAADSNRLKINVQRAIAKVRILPINSTILSGAGSSSNAGTLTLFGGASPKWAVGNIATAEYPFQIFDNNTKAVKSANYDQILPIVPAASNPEWVKRLDNTRWIPAAKNYATQQLTVTEVRDQILAAPNQEFSASAVALVPENNNSQTYNHYTSFVVFGGVYRPATYVTDVSVLGAEVTSTAAPVYSNSPVTSMDTMYYVGSFGDGTFFHGLTALKKYVCYKVLALGAGADPLSAPVANYINNLREVSGNTPADLQEYYQGNCFYRVWIEDLDVSSPVANKACIRRNHLYQINVTGIKGPGIADPNDIIDPDPSTIDPIEEADTYVTATIEIMKWHIVNQNTEVELN